MTSEPRRSVGALGSGATQANVLRFRYSPYDVGPVARGGSEDTVCKTAWYGKDFRQLSGASFRIVVDVGEWDQSVAMNTPGQSGDPRSRHYRDLFGMWAADKAFPLLYSPAAIHVAAQQRFVLEPR